MSAKKPSFILLLTMLISGICGTAEATTSWLSTYSDRVLLLVNATAAGAQTDYQMQIVLHSQSGDNSAGDIYLNGNLQDTTNFNDIRFTASDDTTLKDFWIQKVEDETDGRKATVYVKLNTPASGSTDYYLYYGKASDTSASNYDNTFTKDYGESGLVGLWHMDEGTGSTTADSSSNGHNGTLSTGVTWSGSDGGYWDSNASAIFATGSALSFDSANDYVNVTNSALKLTGANTISAWVKLNNHFQNGVHQTIFGGLGLGTATTKGGIALTFYGNTGGLYYNLYTSTSKYSSYCVSGLDDQKWHFIVGTWDGTTGSTAINLYVDGIVQNTSAGFTGPIDWTNSTNVNIGISGAGTFPLNGLIDEVRIYNRALSADEISRYYIRSKYASPAPSWAVEGKGVDLTSSCGAQWMMNDNNNSTVVIDSLSDYNGTFYGTDANTSAHSVAGMINSALTFDGMNDYISAAGTSHLWTKDGSNPVLPAGTMFGTVWLDGTTYNFYYTNNNDVFHATSSDGITWKPDIAHNPVLRRGAGAWDKDGIQVVRVFKENGLWSMLYRGYSTTGSPQYAIGLATSTDGFDWIKEPTNPVLKGTVGKWDGNLYAVFDPWGIIKVGSTYYLWYNAQSTIPGQDRSTGLATSPDLKVWTKDANNPIFTGVGTIGVGGSGGRYCADVFKYQNYYYLIINSGNYGLDQWELYRCKNPTFYPSEREYLGDVLQTGSAGSFDDYYLDTPSVLVNDINKDSFPSDTVKVYYSGLKQTPSNWSNGLAYFNLSDIATYRPLKLSNWADGITICFWIKSDNATWTQYVLSKMNSSVSWAKSTFTVVIYGGNLQIIVGDNTSYTSRAIVSSASINSTWTFICAGWDNSTRNLFSSVNAGSIGTTNFTIRGNPFFNVSPVVIGGAFGGANKFDGSLDDVMIYNRVLSQSEINYLYNGGSGTESLTTSSRPFVDHLDVDSFDSYGSDSKLQNVWHPNPTLIWLNTDPNFVRNGNSMKYEYEEYAEVKANTIDLPYQPGSDWTVDGVKALVLYFYGDPCNSILPMYVKLKDGSGNEGVVTYGDNGEDPNDLRIAGWHEWNIDLAIFDASGVDLTNVKYIYLGFGSGNGSGTVYFDDIQLYPPRCVLSKRSADFAGLDYAPLDSDGYPGGDCVIDYQELAVMADYWLDTWSPIPPSIPNLVAHWPMNEGAGNEIFTDPCDPCYAGTFSAAGVSWTTPGVTGLGSGALNFDGSSGTRVSCGNMNPASEANELTLAIWAKWLGPRTWDPYLYNKSQGLISKRTDWSPTGLQFMFECDTPPDHRGSFSLRQYDDLNTDVYSPNNILYGFIGQWVHLAATFDGTTSDNACKLYLNGNEVASGPFFFGSNTAAGLTIGNTNDEAGWDGCPESFNGYLDEARIYNRALTEDEIGYLADQGRPHIDLYSDCVACPECGECPITIDFKDFAVLANYWLEDQLWP